MLSLRRFTSLAKSYGADLERWPEETQADARALLQVSAEARAIHAAARDEDLAIGAARHHEEAALWYSGDLDAALARLRSGVAGRIVSSPASRQRQAWLGWSVSAVGNLVRPHLGWLGLTTSSGFAVAAGLLIGSLTVPTPSSTSILAAFQATPLHILAD